jgi:hypothetical protein
MFHGMLISDKSLYMKQTLFLPALYLCAGRLGTRTSHAPSRAKKTSITSTLLHTESYTEPPPHELLIRF